MRDMQLVLSMWGAWANVYSSSLYYPKTAAGLSRLLPQNAGRLECSDNDGMIIDSAVCRLFKVRRPEEGELILDHYVKGKKKRAIAKERHCSEGYIRQQLQVAEGFIDGCLCSLGVDLEMDACVKKIPLKNNSKKKLVRYAKSVVV